MMKLKISYQDKEELDRFLLLINNKVDKLKLSKNNKGQFKKAYITIKKD